MVFIILVKYVFPTYQRNTHSKVLAFLYVLGALNTYKQRKTQGDVSFWVMFILQTI